MNIYDTLRRHKFMTLDNYRYLLQNFCDFDTKTNEIICLILIIDSTTLIKSTYTNHSFIHSCRIASYVSVATSSRKIWFGARHKASTRGRIAATWEVQVRRGRPRGRRHPWGTRVLLAASRIFLAGVLTSDGMTLSRRRILPLRMMVVIFVGSPEVAYTRSLFNAI